MTSATPITTRHRVAVADLGSQAFRLEVAEIDDAGRITSLYRERHPLMLARRGQLGPSDVREAVAVLSGFSDVARRMGAPLRVAATAVFRAQTPEIQRAFVDAAAREAGAQVRILSPWEEAMWSVRGTAGSLGLSGTFLHAEVGGGSVQISLSQGQELLELVPVAIGATSLTRWMEDRAGPPRARAQLAQGEARRLLGPAERLRGSTSEGIGTGGNARSLAKIEAQLAGQEGPTTLLTRQGLRVVLEEALRWRSPMECVQRFGLPRDRAEVVVAGAVLYGTLLDVLDLPTLTVCDDGVRAGLLRATDHAWETSRSKAS